MTFSTIADNRVVWALHGETPDDVTLAIGSAEVKLDDPQARALGAYLLGTTVDEVERGAQALSDERTQLAKSWEAGEAPSAAPIATLHVYSIALTAELTDEMKDELTDVLLELACSTINPLAAGDYAHSGSVSGLIQSTPVADLHRDTVMDVLQSVAPFVTEAAV